MNDAMIVQWRLLDLERLSERFSDLGIGADIGAMTLSELWGLHAFLERISGGRDDAK